MLSEQAGILSPTERIVVLLSVPMVSLETDNLAKARNDYTNYQAQIIVEKARAIRSKNLVVKLLKCQDEQDRLAGKKRKATSNGNSATKSNISCKLLCRKRK